MTKTYNEAKLGVLKVNFSNLLRTKTKPYTAERFRKKQRLKELYKHIKEIEEGLK